MKACSQRARQKPHSPQITNRTLTILSPWSTGRLPQLSACTWCRSHLEITAKNCCQMVFPCAWRKFLPCFHLTTYLQQQTAIQTHWQGPGSRSHIFLITESLNPCHHFLHYVTLLQAIHLTDRGRFSSHNRLKIMVTGRVRRGATGEKQSEPTNFMHLEVKSWKLNLFRQTVRNTSLLLCLAHTHTRRKPIYRYMHTHT